MGFKVWGLGFGVWGLGLLEFKVQMVFGHHCAKLNSVPEATS